MYTVSFVLTIKVHLSTQNTAQAAAFSLHITWPMVLLSVDSRFYYDSDLVMFPALETSITAF
jgi:hypothetical protein